MDRARQVCGEYRRALLAVAPAVCSAIDEAAIAVGERWVAPQIAVADLDSLVTVAEAADLVGRSARWIYGWVAADRERMKGHDPIIVRVRDVIDAVAYERDWRRSRRG